MMFFSRSRGRPKKKPFDVIPKESLRKRADLMSTYNVNDPQMVLLALSGSSLHHIFCKGYIDEKELKSGLFAKKLFQAWLYANNLKRPQSSHEQFLQSMLSTRTKSAPTYRAAFDLSDSDYEKLKKMIEVVRREKNFESGIRLVYKIVFDEVINKEDVTGLKNILNEIAKVFFVFFP